MNLAPGDANGAVPEAELEQLLGAELAGKVDRNLEDLRRLAARDEGAVTRLGRELRGSPIVRVPHLDDDVHDIVGLLEMDGYLFADAEDLRASA
jgi:hypothetical protein